MYLYHEKGVQSPGTVVTDSWELPHGYWELNPDHLKAQCVFLTVELSLQPRVCGHRSYLCSECHRRHGIATCTHMTMLLYWNLGMAFRERKLKHCWSDYIQINYFSSVNSPVFFLVSNMYKYLYLHNTHILNTFYSGRFQLYKNIGKNISRLGDTCL